MTEKVKVCSASEITEGTPKLVEANGKQIAIFNVGGKFFAISNVCAHADGSLAEGSVAGDVVTCPLHAWEYNVKTGESLTMPGAKVEQFKVIVENDEIYVEV